MTAPEERCWAAAGGGWWVILPEGDGGPDGRFASQTCKRHLGTVLGSRARPRTPEAVDILSHRRTTRSEQAALAYSGLGARLNRRLWRRAGACYLSIVFSAAGDGPHVVDVQQRDSRQRSPEARKPPTPSPFHASVGPFRNTFFPPRHTAAGPAFALSETGIGRLSQRLGSVEGA